MIEANFQEFMKLAFSKDSVFLDEEYEALRTAYYSGLINGFHKALDVNLRATAYHEILAYLQANQNITAVKKNERA